MARQEETLVRNRPVKKGFMEDREVATLYGYRW